MLKTPAEVVVVVDRHRAANVSCELQDRRGAGLREIAAGVLKGARHDACRIAEQAADQVEVVNGMDCDLHPRHALQEREQVPGREEVEVDLDVRQSSEDALVQRVRHRQHHRREAELEVDRRRQAPFASQVQNTRRIVEVAAHRLLQQHRRLHRQGGQDVEMRLRREGKVEHGIREGGGVREAVEDGNVPRGRHRLGPGAIPIIEPGDREASQSVGGQMRVLHDAPGSNDDDGPGRDRWSPGLLEGGQRRRGSGCRFPGRCQDPLLTRVVLL